LPAVTVASSVSNASTADVARSATTLLLGSSIAAANAMAQHDRR